MVKKAKKKGRAPPKEKRAATPSKNVSEQSSQNGETAEDVIVTMKEKRSCVHYNKGINLEKVLEKIKSSGQIKCGECKDKRKGRTAKGKKGVSSSDTKSGNKAIWMCLECGHCSCGGVGLPTGPQSHVVRHIRLTRHRLVMQLENPQLRWCFPCHSLLPVETEDKGEKKDVLIDVVKLIKDRPRITSDGDDTEDLCSGNGSIFSEIRSQGAVSGDGYAVRGLVNLGNTCFFNSVMQNLLSLDRLREYFLNEDLYTGGGPLVSSLKKLFAETKPEPGSKSVINPRAFFGSVCSKAPQFRGYQQHDSHELLRCLLDGLSTEESNLKKKQPQPTLIDSAFGGEISSTVTCIECKHSSKVCEPFLDLSLPIPFKKVPPKRHQTVSRVKKTKLPPKRLPKARAKVIKDSESVLATEHIDSNFTEKGLVAVNDSSVVLETPSDKTLENNKKIPETATTDTVFDGFWLDFLEPESTQDNNNDNLITTEAGGSSLASEIADDAPASSNHRITEGNTESMMGSNGRAQLGTMRVDDEHAKESNENTLASEMSARTDQGGGDSGSMQNSCVDDGELPLSISDSQVIYMPYKEDEDINGFGGLFDEPEISEGPVSKPLSETEASEAGSDSLLLSVEKCLAHFITPEILTDDNAWHCENCSKNVKPQQLRAKKKSKNTSKPGILENGDISQNSISSASHDRKYKSSVQDHDSAKDIISVRETENSRSEDGSESEESEDDEDVSSEKVKVKRDATKRVLINKAPPILTVHLKRFSQDVCGRLSKLNCHVAFKEFFDLQPYMDPGCNVEEKPVYRLAGVVEHSGTMRGGHYVAYVRGGGHKTKRNSENDSKDSDSSAWYHVSDSYVRQVSLEGVLRCEAYILFYERI